MGGRSYKRLKVYKAQFDFSGSVICGICLKPIVFKSDLTVDHIKPRAKGGNSRLTNLQPAHNDCNQQKADKLIHIGPTHD